MPDSSFFVPAKAAQANFREKASRFIAFLYPVSSFEQVAEKLAALKKEYFDASHICYAWVIDSGRNEKVRRSDAGEPKGTAGAPILEAIRSFGLTNLLVAVVRYFGGTKLGTGGLSRAYRGAALGVLQKAGKKALLITEQVQLTVPLPVADRVLKLSRQMGAEVVEKKFDNDLRLLVFIPADRKEKFLREAENLLRRFAG